MNLKIVELEMVKQLKKQRVKDENEIVPSKKMIKQKNQGSKSCNNNIILQAE